MTLRRIVPMLVVALLAVAGCGGGSGGKDTVTVQLDYQVRGNHGMFYVAQKMGYFEDEGIDVKTISEGTGSPDALRVIGRGQADFGFSDLPSLVTARSQGLPVKALAAVNQVSPLGMCSLAKRHELDDAKSLKGLTVGVHPAGSTYIFYKALLAQNAIAKGDVHEATVTPPYENYLIQKKVDAVICYVDAEVPILEKAAGGPGSLSILLGHDAGYDAYGSGLVTNDKLMKQDPELVQKFTNAYLKAFAYVNKNPEKTAKILAGTSPKLKKNAPLYETQLQADIDKTFSSPDTKATGLGAMTPKRWQETVDVLAKNGGLKGKAPKAKDCYSAKFVNTYYEKRS